MFDIEFIHDEPEPQEDGSLALRGRTTLGDYADEFLASLAFLSRAAYERHWIEAAQRLVQGCDRTGFFTSAYQFWWTMWREGEDVFVHEQLLTEGTLRGRPFDPRDPYLVIGDRYTESAGGQKVSEWRLQFSDIKGFLARRSRQYIRA